MVWPHDGIGLPVAHLGPMLNMLGTQINTALVGYRAPAISPASPLAVALLAAQMQPKIAASALVAVNVLVDRLVAGIGAISGLLWTELLANAVRYFEPSLRTNGFGVA